MISKINTIVDMTGDIEIEPGDCLVVENQANAQEKTVLMCVLMHGDYALVDMSDGELVMCGESVVCYSEVTINCIIEAEKERCLPNENGKGVTPVTYHYNWVVLRVVPNRNLILAENAEGAK